MTAGIPEDASRHLRLVSGISAVFVVFIHGTTLKYDETLGWSSPIGQLQAILSHNLFHVALPLFFINAAFFLFYGLQSIKDLRPRILRRGITLLMPYLAWSGFWVSVGLYFEVFPYTSISEVFLNWVLHPPPGQFWFLRDLIALVILAPLVCLTPTRVLAIFGALIWLWWLMSQTVVTLDLRSEWYEVISNEALCWFLIGALGARFAGRVLYQIGAGLSVHVLALAFGFWVFGPQIPLPMQVPHGLSVTAGTLFWLGAAPFLRTLAAARWTTVFSGYGFLIYAGHHPAITLLQEQLFRGTAGRQLWHLAVYMLTPFTIIAVLLCVFSLLSVIAPKIVYVANGGRPLPDLRSLLGKEPA